MCFFYKLEKGVFMTNEEIDQAIEEFMLSLLRGLLQSVKDKDRLSYQMFSTSLVTHFQVMYNTNKQKKMGWGSYEVIYKPKNKTVSVICHPVERPS